MKKFLLTIAAIVMVAIAIAQTPNAFKYQAIARDAAGNVIQNQNVSFRISILENGSDVYIETFNVTTNNYGLVNLEIGNGAAEFGDFAIINWESNTFAIKIELDVDGGTAYEVMGTSDLLSVPYALHAKTAENVFSGNYNDLANTPDLSNFDSDATDDFSGDYADLTNKPTLAGDVTGDISTNTVEKIQGMNVSSNIPANGQVLKWNTVTETWEPSDDALGAAGTTDGVVTSIGVTGTTTKTITLMRSNSLGDLTAIFTDNVDDADADATNELQDISLSGTNLSISNGSTIDLSGIDTDTDTHLSEAEVDTYVSNNGYLTSEVDGSTTNEIQSLSLSGSSLSISSGNSVDLSGLAGTDTDNQTLSLSGTVLTITDGNSVNLGLIDTDTQLSEAEVDAFVSNNGYLTSEVDGSITNEIQDISLSGTNLTISSGSTIDLSVIQDGVDDADADPTNEIQTVEYSPAFGWLYMSGTDPFTYHVELPDVSSTNELQTLSLSGNNLTISSGNTVDLSSLAGSGGTDDQNLILTGNVLSIEGGTGSVDLSNYINDADASTTNELQSLTLSGSTLSISSGNSVNLSTIDTDTHLSEAEVDTYVSNNGYLTSFTEVDGSTTNEIQSLSLSGSTLSISSGNSVDLSSLGGGTDTDDQTLSLSGTTLTIADGNSVNLSSINTDDQTLVEILTANPSAGYLRITQVNVPSDDFDVANKYYVDNKSLSSILSYENSAGNYKITSLGTPTISTDAATKGYVDSQIPANQTLSLSGSTLYISSGNSVDLSSLGGSGGTDDQTLSLSGYTLTIEDGNSVDLSSIDTKLNETQVDAYVSNNGYLTSEVDGSTTNELQTISLSGTNLSISSGNTISLSSIDTKLTEAQVDTYVSNNGYLTSETDGSTTNELQTLSLSGSTLTISSGNSVNLSSLGGSQTLSEVLTTGNDAGNKNIVNVAKLGVGTSSVSTCAAAEVASTTGGFMMPRMTSTQRDAIPSPAAGLMIFNTSSSTFQGYTGAPTITNYSQQTVGNTTQATSTLEQTLNSPTNGTLNNLDLLLFNYAVTSQNVVVRIYEGATLLGTSNTVAVPASSSDWVSFSMGGISLTSGTTYKIMIVTASSDIYWARSNTNVIVGEAYVNSVAQTYDFCYWLYITTGGGWVNLH